MDRWERVYDFGLGSGANKASSASAQKGILYHRKAYKAIDRYIAGNPDLGFQFVSEPWLRKIGPGKQPMCQPDGVLLDELTGTAIVVEAKLNWKDGRDEKLLGLYLGAVRSAFAVSTTWPLLVTQNVRGYRGQPLVGLKHLEKALEWTPGQLTPVMLLLG